MQFIWTTLIELTSPLHFASTSVKTEGKTAPFNRPSSSSSSSVWISSCLKPPNDLSHIEVKSWRGNQLPFHPAKPAASRCIFHRYVATSKVASAMICRRKRRLLRSPSAGAQSSLSHFVLLKWNDWFLAPWHRFKGKPGSHRYRWH